MKQWLLGLPSGAACLLTLIMLSISAPVSARPVTYTGGQVLVADVHPDSMAWRYGYSGSFRWSASVGGLYVDDFQGQETLDINYIRGARLLKRWNWPKAQANVFVWGGVGHARTASKSDISGHAGFQADFETRRIYTSVVSEHYEGPSWRYRTDTVALGFAPYEHDFDKTALWLVVKGMRATHSKDDDPKSALMLRLFNPKWWLEVGVHDNGDLLGNVMFNF